MICEASRGFEDHPLSARRFRRNQLGSTWLHQVVLQAEKPRGVGVYGDHGIDLNRSKSSTKESEEREWQQRKMVGTRK
jgi:hypothetical protein